MTASGDHLSRKADSYKMDKNTEGAANAAPEDTYGLSEHASHMRGLLATKTLDSVVTMADLLGRADIGDERMILLTRNFIQGHRQIGVRSADLDREIADRRRKERAAKREAAHAVVGTPADTETQLYRWIDEAFDRWGVRVNAKGMLLHPELGYTDTLNTLVVLNSERPSGLAFKEGAIRAGLDRVVSRRRAERQDDLRAEIACDKLSVPASNVVSLLEDVLRLGLSDHNSFAIEECARLVMKFIWQVKRKMLSLPVTNHIMIIFVGAQGAGKTVLVRALCSPVEEVVASVDLKTVTDERVIDLFTQNYVGSCDELDKSERASMESLKRIITETAISRRPMRSNATVLVPQNLTFIGASNRDIGEAIIDETGSRRFVALHTIGRDDDRSPFFWDAVNSFSWLDLWRAVDPRAPDPTGDMLGRIADVQRGERSLSNMELWLQHLRQESDAGIWRGGFTSTADLYTQYRVWEQEFAPRAESSFGWWSKAWARLARQGGIPFAVRHTRVGNGYVYTGGSEWLGAEPGPRPAETAAEKIARLLRDNGTCGGEHGEFVRRAGEKAAAVKRAK